MIYGTLMTSFIALLIAVPVSFGIALFLTELSPALAEAPAGHRHRIAGRGAVHRLRHVGPAGVRPDPGRPTCSSRCSPLFGGVPVLGALFSGPAGGHRHPVGRHHPGDHDHPVHRRGDARRVRRHAADAQGVGLRAGLHHLGGGVARWCCPTPRPASIGGIMLGLGRALGETMAVTFVIGNFNQLDSLSLFEAANSITSALANEFAEAGEGLHQASLIYLGLVLFFITFVVLTLSQAAAVAAEEGRREPDMSAVDARMRRRGRAGHATAGASVVNAVALTLSLAAMAFGLFWLVWILFETVRLGVGGLALSGLHRDDAAAAGRDRRPGQCHLRLAGDGVAGHAARHADRHHGRHLPGRVRPEGLARQRHALHQRHPAVGAVDRDRPVHLRGGRGAAARASPALPACWRWR